MILEKALEVANTWHFRLIRAKRKQKELAEALSMAPSRVSRLLSAKREVIAPMRVCDFCAVEGIIAEWEKIYDEKKRDE